MWRKFHKAWKFAYTYYSRFRSKNITNNDYYYSKWFIFSSPDINYANGKVPSFTKDELSNKYMNCLVLDEPSEDDGLAIPISCLSLATQWHILMGGLCLHSSAVILNDRGYLFLGDSGAGKSTVAQMSLTINYEILGDDINFIFYEDNFKLASGPSTNLIHGGYSAKRPLLKCVFILIQDTNDFLVKLTSQKTAISLFKSFMQTPQVLKLPVTAVSYAFQTISKVSRSIPGYELHFRKSPDFWKLIDAEFPD